MLRANWESLRRFWSAAALMGLVWLAAGDRAAAQVPEGLVIAIDNGSEALDRGDSAAAIALADGIVKDFDKEPVAWRSAGDLYLRAGAVKKSIPQFLRYIERYPEREPDLWQYGIALAFAGEYKAGAKLFELHRTVNSNDVENALWHFYCVAKDTSPEAAKLAILPAPGDRRVPMDLLLKLYRGEADEQAVRAAVAALPKGSQQAEMGNYYAELYLAMHADALGQRDRAIELATKAAATKDVNYMTDIGRVYLARLREAAP
jgi:lipoprotein NlpI